MSEDRTISRRNLLVGSVGAVAASAAMPAIGAVAPAKKRVLRIAHMTDMHVQPEREAALGFQKCIEHAQGQKDKPNMIFTGGDLIMESLNRDKDRVQKEWDIYLNVIKANADVPVEHCLGNHDVFGWGNRAKFSSESKFGKIWAMELLQLSKPYRSFDKNGWHFIVLDSTHPTKDNGNGYIARLDDEQYEWLKDDLAKTPAKTPIFVMSHIPIIGVCSMFDGENEKTGNWVIPGSWVHIDARRIKDAFKKHPNVKICVSGHEHLLDQVVYNDVNYFCNGAVSGGWWGGDYHECTYGYALIDLYDDGSFTNKYVKYGWTTKP